MDIYKSSKENLLKQRKKALDNNKATMSMTDSDIELFSLDDSKLLPKQNLKESSVDQPESDSETLWATSVQMFIPFLLSGFGMVAASLLLDVVQHWPVYQKVSEVYILVPALLGLKGNLEMTLASRLSTHANLGHLDSSRQQWNLTVSNLALIQCQAIIVGFLASLAAVILGWVPSGQFDINHALLLCASSVATASGASLLLGVIMIGVIILSRRFRINPDNIATPIAASLGDLTTLACLSWLASLLYKSMHSSLSIAIIAVAITLVPLSAWYASKNKYTMEVLENGWVPVVSAMLISSVGGLVLDYTVSQYKGVAVFQLVINGVGGNLVAVQASRISTQLHSLSHLGQLPPSTKVCLGPCNVFCDNSETNHSTTARMLMAMVIPGHLTFSYTISYLQAGHTSFTPLFLAIYLSAALIQVFLLLYIAQVMILWMWKMGIDPDNSAIPYLTAIGDLLGTFLLGVAFQLLFLIGDRDSDLGD
ncbi:solute carrier family 41 member 1-like [Agrilus planipennis]|uniref:Solute carrier family 41 member 1-like n=1 Tax=Agrilus planipennis TaxID=224129 RepID=A0A1W4XRI1_AGRPL|nr:solute carrier family 41 member 1-like [Agrilus planipennis]